MQHQRPILSLRPARPSHDGQPATAVVVLAGQELLQLPGVQVSLKEVQGLLGYFGKGQDEQDGVAVNHAWPFTFVRRLAADRIGGSEGCSPL